jgi:two-component system KDP operon response regulator KdpE
LRKKIEMDPSDPKYLLTDAYVGYRFAELPAVNDLPVKEDAVADEQLL